MTDSIAGDYVGNLIRQYRCELANAHSCYPHHTDSAEHSQVTDEQPTSRDSSELFRIEVELLKHVSVHELRLRVAALRDSLSDLMTKESYLALAANFCDLKTANDRTVLLQEAHYLAARVHRRYTAIPAVERLRADLVLKLGRNLLGIACACITIIAVCWNFSGAGVAGLASSVAVFGVCGASLSTVMRLYQIDPRYEPSNTWLSIMRGQSTILVTPFLGVVFAPIFLLLMRGELVAGQLFPDFRSDKLAGLYSISKILSCASTDTACTTALGEYAKLVVWAFLAGWAERMVPDVLDRLASKARDGVGARADGK